MAGNSTQDCLGDELALFSKRVRVFVFRVDTLVVANTMLMGLIAWIGTYAHRYRHHPLIRFLYLGATTLFLPILSYVVSTLENPYTFTFYEEGNRVITAKCDTANHIAMAMLWIGLGQIIGTNATAIVTGDSREGRSIAPPSVQLVQAVWTSYLAYVIIESGFEPSGYAKSSEKDMVPHLIYFVPYALILAKLLFKYYAWYEARRSLAFGRNPRLIVGYMEQLQCGDNHSELRSQYVPPPLIVMRESTILVEKRSHGYNLIGVNNNGLVTIDKIWQFHDMVLPRPTKKYKDLCLSFALFKLLRCRFAKYTTSEAGFIKASYFIRDLLLNDSDDERVLVMITHELSFLQDYYYTSLPISYSKSWLPILTVSISLSSIAYCLYFIFIFLMETGSDFLGAPQILCQQVNCHAESGPTSMHSEAGLKFGKQYFDTVPLFLLATLVVLVEAREIASYVCSNWTKVGLICGYVNHSSWQQSATIRKCVGLVLHTRCKLMEHWEDKMNQCSILVLHGRRNPLALFRRLAHLPDQKKKVPRAVKAAVVGVVRSYQRIRCPRNGATPLQLKVSDNSDLVWTFHGAKGPADAMLVCHVATSILEVRSRCHKQPLSDHEIVATHLSRYCAYLVAYAPELLPDDALWCSNLYKAVKKDATRALRCGGMTASMAPEAEDQRLVRLLSTSSEHYQVLKDGAELGRRLAELPGGEEVAWKALAGFWSETIVCVAAACDKIDMHAEAVARGGELVTLLWALLAHIGGVDEDAVAATHGAPADV